MSAKLLDGKLLASQLKQEITASVHALKHQYHCSPRVVSIVVGDDPSSLSYVTSQQRTAESLGIHYELQRQPATISQQSLINLINDLNVYQEVHGIMLNKPMPASIDFSACVKAISPAKDIEGMNLCTPAAAIALLKSSGVDLAGKEAVVLGRSEIVGKPLAMLLLNENCTVTICHSGTSKAGHLFEHLKRADIIMAAIGRPLFVTAEHVKEGVIIIDVGINEVNGKIVGDVDFSSCLTKAAFISPVPGGVGPVTSVMLMKNVVKAFQDQICQKS